MSLFLSSRIQIFDEYPDRWCYTTIVKKAVTETLHALSTNWGVLFPVISFWKIRRRAWQLMIYNNRALKLFLKHFTPFRHIEFSLFLSSPFQVFGEDPDKWWKTTIVCKAVAETLHALSTNWSVAFPVISISKYRWRSGQLVIYKNRN